MDEGEVDEQEPDLDFGDEDDFEVQDMEETVVLPPSPHIIQEAVEDFLPVPHEVSTSVQVPIDVQEEGSETSVVTEETIFEERVVEDFRKPESLRNLTEVVFSCSICGSTWDSARRRNGHMATCKKKQTRLSQSEASPSIPASQPVLFPCDMCSKSFDTVRGVTSHKGRVHKKSSSTTLPM